MYFEPRWNPPPVSKAYEEAREHYLAGRIKEARAAVLACRDRGVPPAANDFLLASDISRACGRTMEYLATIRVAKRHHPDDPDVHIAYCRINSSTQRFLQAERDLESLIESLPPDAEHRLLATGMLAACCSMMNAGSRARRHADTCTADGLPEDPFVLYELAYMEITLTEFSAAIERFEQTLAVAPHYQRARLNLIYAHLAIGQVDEARRIVDEGLALPYIDAHLGMVDAMMTFAGGDFEASDAKLRTVLEDWPDADFASYLRAIRFMNLMALDRIDEARALGESMGEDFAPTVEKIRAEGEHVLIPMPFLSQRTNQCVPTTVCMAVWPHGIQLNADELFSDMIGRDGTAIWRMRQIMMERGYRVESVRSDMPVIRELLRRRIPMIGLLHHPMNSHVEVICGFDDRLDMVHVRDPMGWFPVYVSCEELSHRYGLNGEALWIVLPESVANEVEIPRAWLGPMGQALSDLQEGANTGNREMAEAAFAQIPGDHACASVRDQLAGRVVITPAKLAERIEAQAEDEEAHPVARLRALMSIADPDKLEAMMEIIDQEQKKFGPWFRRFMDLQAMMRRCEWRKALPVVESLIERSPASDNLWANRSDLLGELGDFAGAQESLARAIEISPLSPWLREKAFALHLHHKPYHERRDEITALGEEYPDNTEIHQLRASVLNEDPDGLEYERAMRDVIRYFPRDPISHIALAMWYLRQDREDLAADTLAAGRTLIGEEEFPRWGFEMDEAERTDDTPPGPAPSEPDPDTPEKIRLLGELEDLFDDDAASGDDRQAVIDKLIAVEAEGGLLWTESAQLLTARLRHAMVGRWAGIPAEEVAALLPADPPGPREAFVLAVLDPLPLTMLDRNVVLPLKAWTENVCDLDCEIPDLHFHVGLLHEQVGNLEGAIHIYERIRETFPGYSSAHYRMGEVHTNQGQFPAAIEAFQASLEVSPGMPGSLMQLSRLAAATGDTELQESCLERLCALHPYGMEPFFEWVVTVQENRGHDAALSLVNAHSDRHREVGLDGLRAHLFVMIDDVATARTWLDKVRAAETDPHPYFTARTEVNIAIQEGDTDLILAAVDRGLVIEPDDNWLHDVRLHFTGQNDHMAMQEGIWERIDQGKATDMQLRMLMRDNPAPGTTAIGIVNRSPEEYRDHLAEQLVGVLSEPETFAAQLEFLAWIDGERPHLRALRGHYVTLLDSARRAAEARKVAEALHAEDPEDPASLSLMGRVVQDADPKKALEYLEREYEITHSTDTLSRIARSHHLLNDHPKAIATHRLVLEQQPGSAFAVASLMVLEDDPAFLWPHCIDAVRRHGGTEDDYFHAGMVKLALELNETVPEEWFEAAQYRHRLVLERGGFRDEKSVLEKALGTWCLLRGDKQGAKHYLSFWKRLTGARGWPGRSWIPS